VTRVYSIEELQNARIFSSVHQGGNFVVVAVGSLGSQVVKSTRTGTIPYLFEFRSRSFGTTSSSAMVVGRNRVIAESVLICSGSSWGQGRDSLCQSELWGEKRS
jgi:hypothetical protein